MIAWDIDIVANLRVTMIKEGHKGICQVAFDMIRPAILKKMCEWTNFSSF